MPRSQQKPHLEDKLPLKLLLLMDSCESAFTVAEAKGDSDQMVSLQYCCFVWCLNCAMSYHCCFCQFISGLLVDYSGSISKSLFRSSDV